MSASDPGTDHPPVVELLKSRLRNCETSSDVIDGYEKLLRSMWEFTARVLGQGGARAVLVRSINLAAQEAPLVQKLQAGGGGPDLSELREQVAKTGCSPDEVMDALIQQGAMVFQALSELAGETLTEPLLRRLREGKG